MEKIESPPIFVFFSSSRLHFTHTPTDPPEVTDSSDLQRDTASNLNPSPSTIRPVGKCFISRRQKGRMTRKYRIVFLIW